MSGLNTYPKLVSSDLRLEYDLSVLFQELCFEDWNDLDFSDISASLYIIPDNLSAMPWFLQVQFIPAVLAPGKPGKLNMR